MNFYAATQSAHALTRQICTTYESYQRLRELYTHITEQPDTVDLSEVGLSLHIEDTQLPLPMPSGEDSLVLVTNGLNFLGQELIRLWRELHEVTTTSVAYCESQVQAAEAQVVQPQPPQPQPQQPLPQPQQVATPPAGESPMRSPGALHEHFREQPAAAFVPQAAAPMLQPYHANNGGTPLNTVPLGNGS